LETTATRLPEIRKVYILQLKLSPQMILTHLCKCEHFQGKKIPAYEPTVQRTNFHEVTMKGPLLGLGRYSYARKHLVGWERKQGYILSVELKAHKSGREWMLEWQRADNSSLHHSEETPTGVPMGLVPERTGNVGSTS
jgi:hypothetical protein